MDHHPDLGDIARAVIDANLYMILGTAGEDGHPLGHPRLLLGGGIHGLLLGLLAGVDALPQHRRTAAGSIVIFDSQTPIGTAGVPVGEGDVHSAQAVYMSGVALEVTGVEVSRGVDIFSRGARAQGAGEWTKERVQPPAHLRLYRATASQQFIICPVNHPEPCSIHGRTDDHRVAVQLADTG